MVFDIKVPYQGVILKQDVNVYQDDKSSWFEPSLEEVKEAENILLAQLSVLNKEKMNQGDECPDIEKNLNKYVRQYIGYYNHANEKIIFINMLWGKSKNPLKNIENDYIIVLDGCSHYWRVKVNLSDKKLFDLMINGSA